MRAELKSGSKPSASVRQSVTMPAQLAGEVRRVAKERHLTMSGALVSLVQRGIEAEAQARQTLAVHYDRFMAEKDDGSRKQAGQDLIRTIFGDDAIAEDPIR